MKLRKILALLCALCMVVGLTACGGLAKTEDKETAAETNAATAETEAAGAEVDTDAVLKIASPQSSATLNPVNGYDYWYMLRYGVCETLMGFDEQMVPYEWLVDSYEMADDQLTWTFHIRDNVTFSNGNQLTAEIAKACIEKAFAESNTAATYFAYDEITADGQALTIKTSTPVPTLAYIMADPVFVMYDVTQDLSNCEEEGVIGTGPFVFSAFDSVTGNTSVVRNDNYWNGTVQCAGIDFQIIQDPKTISLQVETGEVDASYAISYTDIDKFTGSDAFNVLSVASGRTDYGFMNQNKQLGDLTLRQAIQRAINKPGYCENLLGGQYVYGKTPLTAALPYGYDELNDLDAYDPEGAAKLLDDAGYVDKDGDGFRENKDGEAMVLDLVYYPGRAEIPVMAEAMEQDLKGLGININLKEIDQGSAWNTFMAGEYDILIMSISMTSSGDPQSSLASYFTTNTEENQNYNSYGYSNEKVDELMTELKAEFDIAKRQDLVKQMEQEIMNDSAIISLCYPMMNFVTTTQVSGITSHPSDYYWVSAETSKLK